MRKQQKKKKNYYFYQADMENVPVLVFAGSPDSMLLVRSKIMSENRENNPRISSSCFLLSIIQTCKLEGIAAENVSRTISRRHAERRASSYHRAIWHFIPEPTQSS
jgi:hypothetical protein